MPYMKTPPPVEAPSLEPIAICGMGCRLPGAVDSPSSLWEMLVNKRSGSTPKVPKTRFNIDAHFHKNNDRPGSFNVLGGYFLDGKAETFDPTFFNLTPVEAMWLDPQQRKMLEVCYEAIESAGLTLESISGSNTAVMVGSFTADYQQMTFRDPDFRHSYAATGVDPGIISNRIGNVFDLKGPSFTINTACSSSVYAVHNACHALRARDCDAALVGGVNLILTVDQHMNTAKLGVLSPTSFCHTFDARADGYGRGEGAGALYLKRLSDAVRDGDVIRAAIRSSAVNTNGKVPGYGLTFPNVKGQEDVIRAAYSRGSLDPNKTAYFECHGTGTSVGDPIEVRAVSRAMNDSRSPDKPLLVGAVKPNIGHSEAASGVFAIIKAAMMVESGVLPGVAGLENVNPEIPESELNVKINKDTSLWPQGFSSRVASVSSFGYGGTNAHVIVEDVRALVPHYEHGLRKELALYSHSSTRPLLVTFSAHDKTTLERSIEAHSKVVDQYYLSDVAHTLNIKRSRFSHKAFVVANEASAMSDISTETAIFGSSPKPITELAFMFTGQGAQWAGVGRNAIKTFPVFRETVRKLDRVLKGIKFAPKFTIEQELCAPPESSSINNPNVSQPTLVATQIALVDLLASWNIVPVATVGHSAGEYAASYAAGIASAPEIIVAAYYRGYALENFAPSGGTMLAVGKGLGEVAPYLRRFDAEIVVACENSPESVTLSGTRVAILEAKRIFDAEGIFARELKTGMAYHSPQMRTVTLPMIELVEEAYTQLDSIDRQWRCPRRRMISSVTNTEIPDGVLGAEYWASNLTSRVFFNTAVSTLVTTIGLEKIGGVVEIGPHSALSGPFKQICKANGFSGLTYVPTLLRNQDTAKGLLNTAGRLFLEGYPVDLYAVNQLDQMNEDGILSQKASNTTPFTLVDLPPYQWNYDKVYWAEPRQSAEYRNPSHARHDLLGSKIPGLSDRSMVWRNVLRLKDVPWLVDHKLGGSIMFPAAGHMAIAMEAARQYCEVKDIFITGMTLRNVELKTALIVPETDTGLEIQLRLSQTSSSESSVSFSFSVESCTNNIWSVHSTGSVFPVMTSQDVLAPVSHPLNIDNLSQRTTGKRWNDTFKRVGFEYGPSFDTLSKIRTHDKYYQAAGEIPIATTTTSAMVDESRYILHPSAVDSLLQLCIISIHAGLYQEMPWGVVPIRFEEVTFIPPIDDEVSTVGQAIAWNDVRGDRARYFNTDAQLSTQAGRVLLEIKGLHTVAYEAALPPRRETRMKPMPYTGVVWKPDITITSAKDCLLASDKARPAAAALEIMDVLDLLNHKQPLSSVLLVDPSDSFDIELLVSRVSSTTALHLAQHDATNALKDDAKFNRLTLREPWADLESLDIESQDLVIIAAPIPNEKQSAKLRSILSSKGQAILLVSEQDIQQTKQNVCESNFSTQEIALGGHTLLICSQTPTSNGHIQEAEPITLVYSRHHSAAPHALANTMLDLGMQIQVTELCRVDTATDKRIVLYNPLGNLLSQLEPTSFQALKDIVCAGANILWVTMGVGEGKCASGAMVQGFLRVAREEQKMSKLSLLDVDSAATFASIAKTLDDIMAPTTYTMETEYWLRNGVCHISRLVPNEEINRRMIVDHEAEIQDIPLQAAQILRAKFEGAKITFARNATLQRSTLKPDQVELQVECLESHKQDPQSEIEGPRIISGTVLSIGSDVQSHLQGKTVVACVSNPYDTIVRVEEDLCVECEPSIAHTLVQKLPDLCRAETAIQSLPGSSEMQHVLLLPTSSSMILAFTTLSKIHRFKLTIVVDKRSDNSASPYHPSILDRSDNAEIRRLMSDADGPTAVVAHDFSTFSQEIWRNVQSGVSFILSTDTQRALSTTPDVGPFNRGARFCVSALASTFKTNPRALGQILRQVQPLVKSVGPVNFCTLSTLAANAEERSVLTYNYGRDMVKILPSRDQLWFSSEDAYLLVGCLGGLGRSLTSWMMARGAKHFVFISRSGADKPEAGQLIDSISKAGAIPQVFYGDAANADDVSGVIETVTREREIKGVVHAAMVLEDGMIGPKMTPEKFQRALTPKVRGAQTLHTCLSSHDLDFFVLTSSISATIGQPGQSNYAAANSFLDALAHQRQLAGLPGTSLVLPMVLGVGVVAEHDFLEDKIARRGLYGVDEREMLRGFEAAMSQSTPTSPTHANSTIVMGLDPSRLAGTLASAAGADTDIDWALDPRFSQLRPLIDAAAGGAKSASSSGGGADRGSFAEQIVATATTPESDGGGYEAAVRMAGKHVMVKCGSILILPADQFEFESGRSVGSYGLDSMIGAELRNWLFKELRLNIAFQELLSTELNFRGLAEKVVIGLGVVKP